ncbi:65-kDa microtubule-associated protein 6-like isoform X1 [Canna indica]|uniref:65-kDa microtubule-associated protein 6-like isoform X1 n=1 Tax=Canna indica TaxID=4628 RepID=A0AAQ3Q0J8_9LILI|nr:65-kDa microtubule-associated protein 6-like isoform X1 [Canna indica]
MVGVSAGTATSCGALLEELQQIWEEIGESKADKEHILSEIERECLGIYQRKVDEAKKAKAQLLQSVAAKEAEIAALVASLGEHTFRSTKDKKSASLKEQLASVMPMLENLRVKREERIKILSDVRSQIEKISSEIREYEHQHEALISPITIDEYDLSMRMIDEYQAQLRALQKDKSDRLQKVLEYVSKVHSLCGVLGLNFRKTVDEVHPSLHETSTGKSTSISNKTLEGLAQVILKLKAEKKIQLQKLRETIESLYELWKIMDSSEEERRHFEKLARTLESPEKEITQAGLLSRETIEQTEAEVSRLTKLKASRMKELVLKRRSELEEECRRAHIEPDTSTTTEKTTAMIDSGLVDPSELVANIESQIMKVKEEAMSRKDIMDRISKWVAACEEEDWLEQYNQDGNRYNAGRGGHINLKRAEKARITVTKIPAMVDSLISRTFSWEDERNKPFLYDGVRLVSILEEYKLTRQQKDEEKRRFRDQKKLQTLLLAEKEAIFGSKSVPKRSNSMIRKTSPNGFMTPTPSRRLSTGSATSELMTPRSYSGRHNGYFKEMRRLSTTPLNFVALPKDDSMSTLTSISGSEPESPMLN